MDTTKKPNLYVSCVDGQYLNPSRPLLLSEDHAAAYNAIPWRTGKGSRALVRVVDLLTDQTLDVGRAPCGLRCRCAVKAITVPKP